ncbi:MAG: type I restriction enzyme HsdR N-terminal domain-containing protein [Azoarcus sp.]|jgi:hypothetical protein|nr:type I restriction enzyme HsdR N-terminal domain-containing protein [Azoarcus sp.]
MQEFSDRIRQHAEHVTKVGIHCATEETTKQALILPLLDILGFSPFDPTRVKAEYGADFPGVKANERVDYALFCHDIPVMFIEAKAWTVTLTNHVPQLARYFNATPEVAVAAITNGREWRFFTDLKNKNVMDSEPFLVVDFSALNDMQIARLQHFRYDEFQPDALRTLAEVSIYLTAFTNVIRDSLRDPDTDFVRYVATRADVQRQFNAKFLDSITPIVKQAVGQAVSDMVVTGLTARPDAPTPEPVPAPTNGEDKSDWVDPDNPRIVTTYAERRFLEIAKSILGENSEVVGKDTESYYTLLYQGKTNRWLMRYRADKKVPNIQICVPLNDERKREIIRAGLEIVSGDAIALRQPDDLMRISGIVFDTLAYCRDDNNFKVKRATEKPDV